MPQSYQVGWRRPKATKHVFIAIPTYGDIKAGCVSALNAVQHNLVAGDISGDVAILAGDCHVDDARNNLCRRFLMSEATHLMFIDADLEFSPNSVRFLLEQDEKVIAGLYPYKNDDEDFPVILEKPGQPQFDERGLVKVKGVPGGFMLIAREVIEKLYKKDAKRGTWMVKGDKPGNMPVAEIFHRSLELGRARVSGDYEFCRKVIAAGYSIWVAPNLKFAHVGDKRWMGSVQDYWFRKSGKYEADAKELIKEMKASKEPSIEQFQLLAKAFGNEPWAADHVLLSVLWKLTKEVSKRPLVVETGSGISTVVFVAAGATVNALESEPIWGAKTERFLKELGFKNHQALVYAPIVKHENIGNWYDFDEGEGEQFIDLVFIDGPRRDEDGMRARICDVMPNTLKACKVVVVDDTDDMDGMKLLDRLNREFGFVFDIHNGPRRQFAVGTRE